MTLLDPNLFALFEDIMDFIIEFILPLWILPLCHTVAELVFQDTCTYVCTIISYISFVIS